jgi:hypothetical protein
MTKLKAIFVDDEPEKSDPKRIKRILDEADIDCDLRMPPKFSEIASLECDLFITDLNLAQAQLDEMVYSGKTLSSEYRINFPTTPIVLITQKEIIAAKAKNIRTGNTDLDLIWYKRDAWEDKERFTRELRSLVDAFNALSASQLDWSTIRNLMKTESADEYNALREANPPIQRSNWTVSEIAEWIRCVIIEYPGILLNDNHAAVRLGIDPEDFKSDSDIQGIFQDAQYTGVFREFSRRWWRDRVLEIAADFVLNHGNAQPLLEGFVPTFNQVYGKDLQHSICVWDKKPIAETICYIYQKPVKLRNSLHYRPDNRPASMEPARVSRTAVRGSNKFDELLLDPGSVETAHQWTEGV